MIAEPKRKNRKWPAELVAQIVEERKTTTLDALAERYDTQPAWISMMLRRAKEKTAWNVWMQREREAAREQAAST